MAYKIVWQLTAKLGSEILVLVNEINKKYQAYQAVCRCVLDCPSRFFCQELTEHFPEKIMKKLSKYDYRNLMDCIFTNVDHTDFGCQRERGRSKEVNPLTPKISFVILVTVCHTVLVVLVWRIWYWINL